MALIPQNELDKYISTTAFEVGHEAMNMLMSFKDNQSARERVIENVTRKLKDAMDSIEESVSYGPTNNQDYLSE